MEHFERRHSDEFAKATAGSALEAATAAAEAARLTASSLADITSSISSLRQEIKDFKKDLLGNGQPGRIQRIEEDIKDGEDKTRGVEKKVWYFSGVAGGLGLVATLLEIYNAFFRK